MSSKLKDALNDILEGARTSRVKEASDNSPLYVETEEGADLRKLAEALRVENENPTYQEFNSFLEGFK